MPAVIRMYKVAEMTFASILDQRRSRDRRGCIIFFPSLVVFSSLNGCSKGFCQDLSLWEHVKSIVSSFSQADKLQSTHDACIRIIATPRSFHIRLDAVDIKRYRLVIMMSAPMFIQFFLSRQTRDAGVIVSDTGIGQVGESEYLLAPAYESGQRPPLRVLFRVLDQQPAVECIIPSTRGDGGDAR